MRGLNYCAGLQRQYGYKLEGGFKSHPITVQVGDSQQSVGVHSLNALQPSASTTTQQTKTTKKYEQDNYKLSTITFLQSLLLSANRSFPVLIPNEPPEGNTLFYTRSRVGFSVAKLA